MEHLTFIEMALRGGAAAVNALLLILIASSRTPNPQRLFAMLFLFGTLVYALISSQTASLLGPATPLGVAVATFNSVFFWWFALSLFDDDFRLTPIKMAPLAAFALINAAALASSEASAIGDVLHPTLTILLAGHAIFVALRDRTDDLVDPRRKFRLAFAGIVGATGVIFGLFEVIGARIALPSVLSLLHAATLFGLGLFFASWFATLRPDFFAGSTRLAAAPQPAAVNAGDRRLLDALDEVMRSGVYREPGLTIADLAARISLPEHQLRRLINGELGFRNFAAYLNERRVADAKLALADPARARDQILQIALDAGFGSIAPFNRVFKATTGETPTDYRRKAFSQTQTQG